MTPQQVKEAQEQGAVVVDMRLPRPFSKEHLPGAINIQFNRADLVDRTEMVLPKDLPLIVHAEPEAIAKIAAGLLQQAGFAVRGHLEGGLRLWKDAGYSTETIDVMGVDDLRGRLTELQVVDARDRFEYKHAHVPKALLMPWTEAWARADEVPRGAQLAVLCGDEVRSSLVASILRRHGRDVRLVVGGMVDWLERGYPVDKGLPA